MAGDMPRCGLYRTTMPLEEHGGAVDAGRLVYFHNHSDQGTPLVLLPLSNEHNKWTFETRGYSVTSPAYMASLERLEAEGIYRLREHFHPDDKRIVAAGSLVQLGYNRAAEPILFFPARSKTENALVFPSQGMRVPAKVYALLERLDLRGPYEPETIH